MIVLDTNVISELMRPAASPTVLAWLDSQSPLDVYTTTVVEAEIFYGIACLDPGQRRDALAHQAQAIFTTDLAGRVLPFTEEAAIAFAEIAAQRRRQGRPIAQFDALIAACARAVGAVIATRDIAGFQECGLTLVNPWEG